MPGMCEEERFRADVRRRGIAEVRAELSRIAVALEAILEELRRGTE